MLMTFYASVPVHLTDKEVDDIVLRRLDQVIEGRWIANGKVYEEHCTSHCFDVSIGDADDPQFAVLKAALVLREELRKKR